jgi:hypothetical protein
VEIRAFEVSPVPLEDIFVAVVGGAEGEVDDGLA